MPEATARYIITADDRSSAARNAALRGFRDMDRGFKTILRSMNIALGIFVGVQLKQAFRSILRAAADSNQEFAAALTGVRDAFRDLLAPKSGMPEVTAQMEKLRETLTDPAVIAAADAITSGMIRGFGTAAEKLLEIIAGVRILAGFGGGNAAVDVDDQIRALEEQRDRLTGLPDFVARLLPSIGLGRSREELELINRQLDELRKRWQGLVDNPPAKPAETLRGKDAAELQEFIEGLNADVDVPMGGFEKGVKESVDVILGNLHRVTQAADTEGEAIAAVYARWNEETMTAAQTREAELAGFIEKVRALQLEGIITSEQDVAERIADFKERQKGDLDEMSQYAKRAAENMQDAFADFLFDPFEDGLKGMLKGFVDVLRRMIAEAAAAKIFSSKDKGGLGFGDFLGGLFGGLLGFQHGGSFKVGGSGGTDSKVVAFRATPGERVSVATPGMAEAGNITLNSYITMSNVNGVTRGDVFAAMKTASDAAVAQIRDLKDRGRL